MMTRRTAIKTAVVSSAMCALAPRTLQAAEKGTSGGAAPANAPAGPFKLPPLPYDFDALEPHIDARTMEIHHDKHHATYVGNLNKAVADAPELAGKSIDSIIQHLDAVPEKIHTAVRNNGGGHFNHTLFWQMMKKQDSPGAPRAELKQAIDKSFGSFAQFKDQFTEAGTKLFGSGWAWLVSSGSALKIVTTPNQDNPLSQQLQPVLGLDVWEHAYYLKYQNKRADYIAAWFNVINWDYVTRRFAQTAE